MATYTHLEVAGSPTLNWQFEGISSVSVVDPNTIVVVHGDGTRTVYTGTSLAFAGGVFSGTITGASHQNGAGTVTFETITGFSVPANTVVGGISQYQALSTILAGNDTYSGWSGVDNFLGSAGSDTLTGGGNDAVAYSGGAVNAAARITVTFNASGLAGTVTKFDGSNAVVGTDSFTGLRAFFGTSGADSFVGSTDASLTGNISFRGGAGNDSFDGKKLALNEVSYALSTAGVNVQLQTSIDGSGNWTGTAQDGQGGTDTLLNVLRVVGSNNGNDTLTGSDFNDSLIALGGDDRLVGGNGNNFFDGGAGNDTIVGGTRGDNFLDSNLASYQGATGPITVNLTGALGTALSTVTGDASVGTDTLQSVEQVRGSNSADTFTADASFRSQYDANVNQPGVPGSFNAFEGLGGNDTINGNGFTRISYQSASGPVTVTFTGASSGTAVGNSSVGTDTFTGVNQVRGSGSGDTIDAHLATGFLQFEGRGGNDTITGGTRGINNFDSNLARYENSTGGITVTSNGSNLSVTGDSSVGTDTLIGVEFIRGTQQSDTYTVSAAFVAQFGKQNGFEGLGGNDTITGNGSTRVDYQRASAAVTVNLETGTAFSSAGGDAAGIGVDTITTGGGVNQIRGSIYGDTLIGANGSWDERFRGEAGNDTIDGGTGTGRNDVTYLDALTGVVVNLATGTAQDGFGGVDTLIHITGVQGGEFGDILTGDGGANILQGQDGGDSITGAGGDDILVGDDNSNFYNGVFGLSAFYDNGADTLDGGDGNDLLIGGPAPAGQYNQLSGGDGTDTVSYAWLSDGVYVTLAGGATTYAATGVLLDTLSGIENITGSQGNDTLVGNEGNNLIQGGGGTDLMFGGGGNDLFMGGTSAVGTQNQIYGEGGSDTVSYAAQTADVYVELRAPAGYVKSGGNFVLTDFLNTAENAIGGSGNDILVGTDNAAEVNLLAGGAGTDLLFGFAGDDFLDGGSALPGQYNQLYGGEGTDTVLHDSAAGSVYAELTIFASYVDTGSGYVLTNVWNSVENIGGGAFSDVLAGDDGANAISGRGRGDILYGRGGADEFYYFAATESDLVTGYDTIADFQTGVDKLNLEALETNSSQITISSSPGSGSTVLYGDLEPGTPGYEFAMVFIGENAINLGDIIF